MDFSDEEWDISDDQWHSLEHKAIVSTQQQQQQTGNRNGLRSATVSGQRLDQSNGQRPRSGHAARKPQPNGSAFNAHINSIEGNSFDNPQLDEDGVPLVLEEQPKTFVPQRFLDETAQREQWRVSRFAQKYGPQETNAYRMQLQSAVDSRKTEQQDLPRRVTHNYQRPGENKTYQKPSQPVQVAQSVQAPQIRRANKHDVAKPHEQATSVRAEVERLKQEKEELARKFAALQTELYTAKGEASVIRSRNAIELKTVERQHEIFKKQAQEEAAKKDLVLYKKEAAYAELVTNNNFLKHELDEQVRKLQTLQTRAKNKPLQEQSNASNLSPRKRGTGYLQDGFDDNDLMVMSPTRSPARRTSSLTTTPTKKRKHPQVDDLNTTELTLRLSQEKSEQVQRASMTKLPKDHTTARNLEFLQSVLGYTPCEQNIQLVNKLTMFAFPSEPSRSLSSILLAEISGFNLEDLPVQVLLAFCMFLQKCVKEAYHQPLSILLDAVLYMLNLDPTVVSRIVVESISKPLQDLLLINARIRFSGDERNPSHVESPPPVNKDVDSQLCLEVMVVVASLVVDEPELSQLFWSSIQQELTLLLLTPMQPLPELSLAVELLSTSVRHDLFGNVMATDQKLMERHIIDKLCILLWDPPRQIIRHARDRISTMSPTVKSKVKLPEPERGPNLVQISEFRLQVVDLLAKITFSRSPHPHKPGTDKQDRLSEMLRHPALVARLTRLLHGEVVNLYASHLDSQHLHAELVNRGTRLLHYLLVSPQALDHTSDFSLVTALKAVTGGIHRFRVALTQIHFREGLPDVGLDCGIEEETTQLAMGILEEYMTPDEAYQMVCAFGKDVLDEEMQDDDPDGQEAEAAVMTEIEK